jgi:anti-sigma factor RsiW
MGDRDSERLIDAWLDGDLPADEAARVETGLRCDPELRRDFGPMVELLRSPEPTSVPAGLRERVVAAVHEQAARERTIRFEQNGWRKVSYRLGWMGAVAASVALFLSGWYGAQWWARPTPVIVAVGPQPEVTNPWVLAAYAQSVAGRGPMFPTPFVVQGAMIEMLADGKGSLPQGASAGQGSASPGRVAPQAERNEPARVPLLPIIQRL